MNRHDRTRYSTGEWFERDGEWRCYLSGGARLWLEWDSSRNGWRPWVQVRGWRASSYRAFTDRVCAQRAAERTALRLLAKGRAA